MAKEVLKKFGAVGEESYFMVTPGVLKDQGEKNITTKLIILFKHILNGSLHLNLIRIASSPPKARKFCSV